MHKILQVIQTHISHTCFGGYSPYSGRRQHKGVFSLINFNAQFFIQ